MLKKLRDWVDHRYFRSLWDDANKRAARWVFAVDPEENPEDIKRTAERMGDSLVLIEAADLFWRLSRKIAEERLTHQQLISSLRDWARLLVSIGDFSDSDEHDLDVRTLKPLDQAASIVRSHCQQLARSDPSFGAKLEAELNVQFDAAKSWGEFKKLVSRLTSKHFQTKSFFRASGVL